MIRREPRENGGKPDRTDASGVEQSQTRIQGPYPPGSAVQYSIDKVIQLSFATVEMQFDPGRVSGRSRPL